MAEYQDPPEEDQWFDAPDTTEIFEDAPDDPDIDFPRCVYCRTELQELADSNPPVRWFRNKFCECRGDYGLCCENCITNVIFYRQQRCNVCNRPWKPDSYRFLYGPVDERQFRAMLLVHGQWFALIQTISLFFVSLYIMQWKALYRDLRTIFTIHLIVPDKYEVFFTLYCLLTTLSLVVLMFVVLFSVMTVAIEAIIDFGGHWLFEVLSPYDIVAEGDEVIGVEVVG